MDSFDNFQYESASSYGGHASSGRSIVDDNSSVYTANTRGDDIETEEGDREELDLTSLSLGEGGGEKGSSGKGRIDEDFDVVLDDLKDEGGGNVVDLPAHACSCVFIISINQLLLITL